MKGRLGKLIELLRYGNSSCIRTLSTAPKGKKKVYLYREKKHLFVILDIQPLASIKSIMILVVFVLSMVDWSQWLCECLSYRLILGFRNLHSRKVYHWKYQDLLWDATIQEAILVVMMNILPLMHSVVLLVEERYFMFSSPIVLLFVPPSFFLTCTISWRQDSICGDGIQVVNLQV